MSTLLNLHLTKGSNVGDIESGPYRYFSEKVPEIDLSDAHPDVINGADLVLGGGGLLIFSNVLYEIYKNRIGRLVVWGVGLNDHSKQYDDSFPPWIGEADLIGVRDWGKGYRWVPCASCMSPLFDREYDVKHDVVAYLRADGWDKDARTVLAGFPRLFNTALLKEVIAFLGSGQTVVMTSYHGAYWASLLGRKVIVWNPFSSRFYSMRHPPLLLQEVDTIGIDVIKQAVAYPNALQECRIANTAFYSDVTTLLGNLTAVER